MACQGITVNVMDIFDLPNAIKEELGKCVLLAFNMFPYDGLSGC